MLKLQYPAQRRGGSARRQGRRHSVVGALAVHNIGAATHTPENGLTD